MVLAWAIRISSNTAPWLMPNRSCSLLTVSGNAFSLAISFLHRSSHLVVRATEFSTYLRSATLDGHSSNAMAMVEPKLDWICMLSSGPMKILRPSMWELKYTPSSLIFLILARENTWKPPESVKIGRSQFMNLWSPPNSLISLSPVRTCRW